MLYLDYTSKVKGTLFCSLSHWSQKHIFQGRLLGNRSLRASPQVSDSDISVFLTPFAGELLFSSENCTFCSINLLPWNFNLWWVWWCICCNEKVLSTKKKLKVGAWERLMSLCVIEKLWLDNPFKLIEKETSLEWRRGVSSSGPPNLMCYFLEKGNFLFGFSACQGFSTYAD